MEIIQSYFQKLVSDNASLIESRKLQLRQNRKQYQLSMSELRQKYEKLSYLQSNYAIVTSNDYDLLVERNQQKKEALMNLTRVSCELGGAQWNSKCTQLGSFYLEQEREI